MSVAFRRESDEEHLEPRFELPIPPGPNRVTARGLALIAAAVTRLEAAVAAEADEAARKVLVRDLRYWRTRLATAEEQPAPTGETVAFGTRVTFRLGGQERTIEIVGDDEAEPAAGRLSAAAPLVRAMLEAEPGELLPFAGKADAIEVVAIAVA